MGNSVVMDKITSSVPVTDTDDTSAYVCCLLILIYHNISSYQGMYYLI